MTLSSSKVVYYKNVKYTRIINSLATHALFVLICNLQLARAKWMVIWYRAAGGS